MNKQELIEALKQLKVQTGSLVCLGCYHEHSCSTRGCAIIRAAVEELSRYEKAEQEGRLVIVPDKLYDLVYDELAPEKSYITEYSTEGVAINFAGDYIRPDELGETVFLTREEAEAALRERKTDGLPKSVNR